MQLADTNVVSELMRKRPDAGALAWREMVDATYGKVTISAVTVDEIMYGLARKQDAGLQAWFDGFIGRNEVLPVTQTIAYEGDGRWREYAGGYQDWADCQTRRRADEAAQAVQNPQAGKRADVAAASVPSERPAASIGIIMYCAAPA